MWIKVLLVDDNVLFRSALRALLECKEGFKVIGEANDAAEAMSLLDADLDVVVIDRYLPDIDGVEVTREIKRRRPDVAVLLLSGMDDPALIGIALAAGASAVLNKGKSLVDLVPTIAALAAHKSAEGDQTPILTA
jgi:DNA-binding NarL/FixJ family response regulator